MTNNRHLNIYYQRLNNISNTTPDIAAKTTMTIMRIIFHFVQNVIDYSFYAFLQNIFAYSIYIYVFTFKGICLLIKLF